MNSKIKKIENRKKKMKKVTVLRLDGCNYCEELVAKLDLVNVDYTTIDAEENGDLADSVEDLLEVYIYPIVVIESMDTNPYYLYRAAHHNQTSKVVSDVMAKKGFLTTDQIVKEILINI